MTIYKLTFIYLLPSFAMLAMAAIIVNQNIRKSMHRAIGMLFGLNSIWFLGMFLINTAPFVDRSAILLYFIFPTIILSTAAFLHFWYHYTQLYERANTLWYKLVFIPILLQICLIPIDGYAVKELAFTPDGVTYSPGPGILIFWLITLFSSGIMLRLFVPVYKKDPAPARVLLIGVVLTVAWGAIMSAATSFLDINKHIFSDLLPHGTLFLMIAVYVNIVKYDFLPSIHKRYNTLFERAPLGIIIADQHGIIREASPVATQFLNLPHAGSFIFENIDEENKVTWSRRYHITFQRKIPIKNVDFTFTNHQGIEKTVTFDSEFMHIGAETLQLIMVRDATKMKEKETKVTYLAYHDQLTGLHNRTAFERELNRLIESLATFSLILIDLNRLKQINDNFGHHAGDQVLQHVASILSSTKCELECIARWAGDEFIVLVRNPEVADQFIDLVIEELSEPVRISANDKLDITLSFGISRFPRDGTTAVQLFKIADERMYEMKKNETSSDDQENRLI